MTKYEDEYVWVDQKIKYYDEYIKAMKKDFEKRDKFLQEVIMKKRRGICNVTEN